jgi:adenosine deaminase
MIDELIRGIPKAELHLHLEGTLEPDLMAELAARNDVAMSVRRTGARGDCGFDGLEHFLRRYYAGVEVLRTEADFADLTAAYLRRAAAEAVRHAEVFFDPQVHLARGVPFNAMVDGISRALDDTGRELGISTRLIACFVRDLGPEDARRTLRLILRRRDVIAAVGLDSAEAGHPPALFRSVFAEARRAGLQAVAHAGEEGPADYVRQALDELRVRRVDHGVHADDDPALVARLARERVPLTMCPLSNLELRVVPSLQDHPLKRLLRAGVLVTINSDDPAYFCGYVTDNYLAAQRALGLTTEDIRTLARNSVTASLLPPERQQELLEEIDEFVGAHLARRSLGHEATLGPGQERRAAP